MEEPSRSAGCETRRARLVVAIVAALTVLAFTVEWRDRSVDIPPGSEPIRAPTSDLPFSFRIHPYGLVLQPDLGIPYSSIRTAAILMGHPTDSTGVSMIATANGLVDHPVNQAQYGLALLALHAGTGAPQHLALAERQAGRLVERAHAQGRALYFPYWFDFARHGDPADVMVAPWYSAMAQGQALSLFVRLYEATGEPAYREAANQTFASFLQLRGGVSEPGAWTVLVDDDGYYWPEEYPAATPDRTFNGMVFAVYGLYDYYRLTGLAEARLLFQAILTTTAHTLEGIRVPGDVSRYCLAHGTQSSIYHEIHIGQLHTLYLLTGDVSFADWEGLLRADTSAGEN